MRLRVRWLTASAQAAELRERALRQMQSDRRLQSRLGSRISMGSAGGCANPGTPPAQHNTPQLPRICVCKVLVCFMTEIQVCNGGVLGAMTHAGGGVWG